MHAKGDNAERLYTEWLVAEGLGKYVERFQTSRIGVDVLGELTERDVPDLGIALGDR